jgi:hypothetical protein
MNLALCTRDTSAANRPVPYLLSILLLATIESEAKKGTELGEEPPTDETINKTLNLIAEIPARLIGQPSVSPFYGEVHISWGSPRDRQVVLMVFPNRAPLVHYYPGGAVEEATPTSLTRWLTWLRE